MKDIKRILVGLDLTEMDAKLIQYSCMLAKLFKVQTVYFVHISRNLELPEQIKKDYPDLLAPMDETIKHEIQESINEHWQNVDGCQTVIEVKEGNPSEKIVRWTKVKEVDLLIMGKKIKLSGSGIIPNKIAKIMYTSMLFVPENAKMQLKNVFIPIDFSRFSGEAVKVGYHLANEIGARPCVHYAYHVPIGYHKTGKSFDEFSQIMRKHAEDDMSKFLAKQEIDKSEVKVSLSLDKTSNAAGTIKEAAQNQEADLIIMSSKGKTGIASVILGSVTEKLINLTETIPLLILKDKKENMSFLDALMKI